jgi:hypothetical protein
VNDRVQSPHEEVTGVLDDATRLAATLEALRSAGFQETAVAAYGGEEALSQVDPDGRRHGLLGRIARTLDTFGQNGEEHRAAAEELRADHLLLAVTVSGAEEKDRAASTLQAQGVHRLRYWGRWEIEVLSE